MKIDERVAIFERLFDDLTDTNSRIDKEVIINEFRYDYPELVEDLTIILETLDNRHPIGWTFTPRGLTGPQIEFDNIWEMIQVCKSRKSTSYQDTSYIESLFGKGLGDFIQPIVNRTLRLGIGKSLLIKDKLSPMLAKKYEGNTLRDKVTVTEKLDGNRCLAYFDTDSNEWRFQSRNGKPMNVDFEMSLYPKEFVYDGEVLSTVQTAKSVTRSFAVGVQADLGADTVSVGLGDIGNEQLQFNKTSGLINSKRKNKDLVFNIFDIVSDYLIYSDRRKILNEFEELGNATTRILPVLYTGKDIEYINKMLDSMVTMGGEGLMLNMQGRSYENKRTDALLKYKKVQYCDMVVTGIFEGKGKYAGACGGLVCYMYTEDGGEVNCDVGTGLSDAQRISWGQTPELIIGKIVQVGYHEKTQGRSRLGTNVYSLRFPRLVKVREDKDTTSEF